jgi:hypothetical protein
MLTQNSDYAMGWTPAVRLPAGIEMILFSKAFRHASGAHPACYATATGDSSLGGKEAEVKMRGGISPLLHTSYRRGT